MRIDLITDRLSVWDFPFKIGALMELTETEFLEHLHGQRRPTARRFPGVPLKSKWRSGQHLFLWMEIIAGLPAERLLHLFDA